MSNLAVMPVAVGPSWIALDAASVREVLGRTAITRVPGAPAGLVGIVPWRGRAIAALDLAAILGGDPLDQDRARTVIVAVGTDMVALPVDRVREVCVGGEPRSAHIARFAHVSRELDVEHETFALFELADWLDTLDRSPA